jgi:hypothetical protein
VKQS